MNRITWRFGRDTTWTTWDDPVGVWEPYQTYCIWSDGGHARAMRSLWFSVIS